MPQHPGVQEILIDRGQFIAKGGVEMPDDFRIALHGGLPRRGSDDDWPQETLFAVKGQTPDGAAGRAAMFAPLCSRTISRIIGRHLQHCGEIPSARCTDETVQLPPAA
jgi:hypothetical protein